MEKWPIMSSLYVEQCVSTAFLYLFLVVATDWINRCKPIPAYPWAAFPFNLGYYQIIWWHSNQFLSSATHLHSFSWIVLMLAPGRTWLGVMLITTNSVQGDIVPRLLLLSICKMTAVNYARCLLQVMMLLCSKKEQTSLFW